MSTRTIILGLRRILAGALLTFAFALTVIPQANAVAGARSPARHARAIRDAT